MPDLLGTSKWEVGHVGSPLSDQAADLKAIFILVLVVKRSEVQRGMGPRAAHAAQQSEPYPLRSSSTRDPEEDSVSSPTLWKWAVYGLPVIT